MARTHIAKTRVPVDVTFGCASCGFTADAVVEGEGHGAATSYIFFDRKRARETALEKSLAEAKHDAQITAAIAPCPRCGKRSTSAVASFAVRSVLAVTGWLALGGACWWLIDDGWRWLVLAALVALAGASARRRRMRFAHASTLLRDVRPQVTLPRAQARSLPPAAPLPPTTAPERIEPTPPTDEPRALR